MGEPRYYDLVREGGNNYPARVPSRDPRRILRLLFASATAPAPPPKRVSQQKTCRAFLSSYLHVQSTQHILHHYYSSQGGQEVIGTIHCVVDKQDAIAAELFPPPIPDSTT